MIAPTRYGHRPVICMCGGKPPGKAFFSQKKAENQKKERPRVLDLTPQSGIYEYRIAFCPPGRETGFPRDREYSGRRIQRKEKRF